VYEFRQGFEIPHAFLDYKEEKGRGDGNLK